MLKVEENSSLPNFFDHILTKGSLFNMQAFPQAARYLAYNLRYLRKKKDLSQQQLADQAQMPRTTLTHMESGQGNPSLQSLLKVSAALGVPLEQLLSRPQPEAIHIPADQIPIENRRQGKVQVYGLLPGATRGLAVERMVFKAGATLAGQPHLPGSHEYLTVISGQMMVYLIGQSYTLSAGDVLSFPGHQRHSYRNPGDTVAEAFSVVLPAPVAAPSPPLDRGSIRDSA